MNSPATPAERLSVTRLSSRPPRPLTGAELGTLRVVADALIPATGGNPSGSSVADFESGVHTALAILDRQFDDITAVLGNLAHIDSEDMYAHLRRFADAEPNRFYTLSLVVSAAYVYSAEMTAALGYPRPHRNPPGLIDAADELETGILDPVMARGPIYVRPG